MRASLSLLVASAFAAGCGGRARETEVLPVVPADSIAAVDGGGRVADAAAGDSSEQNSVHGDDGASAFPVSEVRSVFGAPYNQGRTVWLRLTSLAGSCGRYQNNGDVRGETELTFYLTVQGQETLQPKTYPVVPSVSGGTHASHAVVEFTSADSECHSFGSKLAATSGSLTLTSLRPIAGSFEIRLPDRAMKGSFIAAPCEPTSNPSPVDNCPF